jgi:NADH:ubiquinone oxidoreductase subunit F (NADH-binding)
MSGRDVTPTGIATLPRLLATGFTGAPASLAEHLDRRGPLPGGLGKASAAALIEEIGQAGLTGRGGAGFPAARKLAAVAAAAAAGGWPVVVANGTEGEPASAKDKVLAATQPHLVLDGAAIAATVTGASDAFIVVDPAVAETMRTAVAERTSARLDQVGLHVRTAAPGFVAGEASAVVNWIGRGAPAPRPAPPRQAERGLHGRPTLVNNIETLAHIALIARYGARWFRSAGTTQEPGTMLVTIAGAVRASGVREIEIGRGLGEVLALAGGTEGKVGALLLGGYSGTWVRWPQAAGLPFSLAGLSGAGATPGAGLIAALPASRCPLAEAASIARYLADESAGQCGPCLFGLDAISSELTALARGLPGDPGRISRWLGQVEGRGACKHPDGAAAMIRSALEVFAGEVREHRMGWCTAEDQSPVFPVPCRRSP